MGKKRTSNTGVSIFATEHKVEKKKRKASDVSIFDHVGQAQLQEQARLPQPAQRQVQAAWGTQARAVHHGLALPSSGEYVPRLPSNMRMANGHVNGSLPSVANGQMAVQPGEISMAEAAGVRVPMMRAMQHPRMQQIQQISALPMRKTRSQQGRELSPEIQNVGPPNGHAPLVSQQQLGAGVALHASIELPRSSYAPAPLPLQASPSEIASAFGLDTRPDDPTPPPHLALSPLMKRGDRVDGSPMRRTRSAAFRDAPVVPEVARHGSNGPPQPFCALPMQPTQSMANSGLEALDSLEAWDHLDGGACGACSNGCGGGFCSHSCPSPGPSSVCAASPMRRTRSSALPPLPLHTSISEIVSSFIA